MASQTSTLSSQAATEPQQVVKNPAAEYWSQHLRSFMVPLFKATGTYTEADQASHFKFLAEHIAPKLGPHATAPHVPYSPPASLVGSPVDPSLNFTSNGKAKVRFDYDVIAPLDRTGPDPFGEEASRKELHQLASVTGAYTKWMDYLMDTLFLSSSSETDIVRAKMPPQLFAPPSSIGIDFDGPTKTLKAYIPGVRKSMATGEPCNDIMLKAIRGLDPLGAELAPALDVLSE